MGGFNSLRGLGNFLIAYWWRTSFSRGDFLNSSRDVIKRKMSVKMYTLLRDVLKKLIYYSSFSSESAKSTTNDIATEQIRPSKNTLLHELSTYVIKPKMTEKNVKLIK